MKKKIMNFCVARLIVLFQKYLEEFINQDPETWSPQLVQFPFLQSLFHRMRIIRMRQLLVGNE